MVLIFSFILSPDDTLKCYECSSFSSGEYHKPDCEKIVDDKYLKECKSGEVCSTFASLSSGKHNLNFKWYNLIVLC